MGNRNRGLAIKGNINEKQCGRIQNRCSSRITHKISVTYTLHRKLLQVSKRAICVFVTVSVNLLMLFLSIKTAMECQTSQDDSEACSAIIIPGQVCKETTRCSWVPSWISSLQVVLEGRLCRWREASETHRGETKTCLVAG